MKCKMLLLGGAAIGYVLGSRAGRERFDQLKAGAEHAWHHPRVQEKVSEAEHAIKEKVSDAEQAVRSAVSRETTSEPSVGPDTTTDAALGDIYRPGGPGTAPERRATGQAFQTS